MSSGAPRLLVLGAGRESLPVLHALRALGCHLTVLDGVPTAPGFRSADIGLLASLRLVAGYKILKNLSLLLGLSYNYFKNNDNEIDIPKPFHGLTFKWNDLENRLWPGIFVGVEFSVLNGKR